MPSHGICLRLTHTGVVPSNLFVADVHDGVDVNGRRANAKPGPLYVPFGTSIDLVYTTQVAQSFETGNIRVWVDMGYLTAEFFFGTEFTAEVAAESAIEVQDESITVEDIAHTLNFVGTGVDATSPSAGVVEVAIPGLLVQDDGADVEEPTTTLNFLGPLHATSPSAGVVNVSVAGVGGAVVVEQDNAVVQATTTVLNFIGPGLEATDAGGGQVDVVATGTLGTLTFELGPIQDIDAVTDPFLPTTTAHRFTVTGGNYTLTSTPTINWPGAVAGQIVVLMNVNPSGSNHVILNRGVAEGLRLSNASRKLDPGGSMTLMYIGSVWVELTHTESTTT